MDLGWMYVRKPARVDLTRLRDCRPGRICLIKPSALGDVVQTLPLLGVLRRKFPQADVYWVVNRHFADLLEGHPDLAGVIPFDRRGGWASGLQLLAELRRGQFDLVFDLQGLFRTGLMTLATRAPLRVGLETAREGSSLACHGLLAGTGRQVPARLRYRKVAEALGMGDALWQALVPISTAAHAFAAERLARLPRPILAIHAGAGWETKRWPVEKFAAVARRFAGSVVVVGTPAEAPLASRIVDAKTSFGGAALNLAGQTTLKQLAAVLTKVDVLLSNDSGPLHLGAALGTPIVGVFTCTSADLSGPFAGPVGPAHVYVSTSVSCAASYRKRCPFSGAAHLACLEEISVDRVCQALERVLQNRPQRRSA